MRILFADDHKLLRESLAEVLMALGKEVEVLEAGSLAEAEECLAGAGDLDLILLDLMMPGMRGAETIREISSREQPTPIVVLSGNTDRDIVLETLKSGARGFLPKTIGRTALLNALNLILDGEVYVPVIALGGNDRTGVQEVPSTISSSTGKTMQPSPGVKDLTGRELDVLRCLVKGHPNKLIARELELEVVTVKTHLSNVYRKLGVSSRSQAVVVALESGIG